MRRPHQHVNILERRRERQRLHQARTRMAPRGVATVAFNLCVIVVAGQIVRAAMLVRKRDPDAFSRLDLLNLATIVLIGIGLMLLVSRRGGKAIQDVWRSPLGMILIYFAFCGVSAIWSGEWMYTLFRTIQLAVNLLLIFWIIRTLGNLQTALLALIWLAALSVLCGALGTVRMAGWAFFLRNNAMACVAAIGVVLCLGALKEKLLPLRKVVIPGTFLLSGLVFGLSAAANVSASFGALLVLVITRRKQSFVRQGFAAIAVVAIGWTVLQAGVFNQWLMPGKTTEQIRSLHGRANLWKKYYQSMKEHPWRGHGFPVGEKRIQVLDDGSKFRAASAHNSIIGVAINTGIFGLALVTIVVIRFSLASSASLHAGRPGALTVAGTVSTGVLNSLSYPVMGSHWNWPTTMIMGIAAVAVCYVFLPPRQNSRSMRRHRVR